MSIISSDFENIHIKWSDHSSRKFPEVHNIERVILVANMGLGDTLVTYRMLHGIKQHMPHVKTELVFNESFLGILDRDGIDCLTGIKREPGALSPVIEYQSQTVKTLSQAHSKQNGEWIYLWGQLHPKGIQSQIEKIPGYHIMGGHFFSENLRYAHRKVQIQSLAPTRVLPLAGFKLGWAYLADLIPGSRGINPDITLTPSIFQTPSLVSQINLVYFNAVASTERRSLPFQTSLSLLTKLTQRFPGLFFVLDCGATAHQTWYMRSLLQALTDRGIFNVGLLPSSPLTHVAHFLKQCTGIITVDTGISHLNNAVQLRHVPSVVIYSDKDLLRDWAVHRPNRKNILSGLNHSDKIFKQTALFFETLAS